MAECRSHGLRFAIDDFGAGHSGLNLLSRFQPDILTMDRDLAIRIDEPAASPAVVRSVVQVCRDLNIVVIAEATERKQELRALCDPGIEIMQGYFWPDPLLKRFQRGLLPARFARAEPRLLRLGPELVR